ncbi:MAG: restriction endonuclease subunit S [Kiritimatiellaeota bacterium]|nr:restriction endonuclease subunit S [Kiritimatiellota bacterium]
MVEGWREVELASLSGDGDGGMRNGVFCEVSRKGAGAPMINVGDMYAGAPITGGGLELFNATEEEARRFAVRDGDLFFTRSSVVPAGIAFCNWFKGADGETVVFDSHVIRFRPDTRRVVPMFLHLQCSSPKARSFLVSNAKTAAMTTIDQAVLGRCPVDLPPLPEQRAIAAALSDADALVVALEKLLAKKRALKHGAMRELFSGKRRLRGFSGEWETRELERAADFHDSAREPVAESLRESGATPYYGANGIQDYVRGHTHEGEFVLIAEDGANDLANYPVRHVRGRIWVNNHAHVLSGKPGVTNTRFLAYALSMIDYQAFLVGGTRAKLNGAVLRKMSLTMPGESEQAAIAAILADMDAEIGALTARLEKTRRVRRGMMSELMTGGIRLVAPANTKTQPETTPTGKHLKNK